MDISFSIDTFFYYCAWIGTIGFLIRLVFNIGGLLDSGSFDMHDGDHSGEAFNILSTNTLIGFIMMFGWGGLAAFRQFGLSQALSLIIAVGSGSVFVWIVKYIFKSAKKLISPGSTFTSKDSIGKRGQVYQSVSPTKTGKIQVSINGFTREFNAISDLNEIASFEPIEITKVIDHKTVMVKTIKR